jgi:hypothetical protein
MMTIMGMTMPRWCSSGGSFRWGMGPLHWREMRRSALAQPRATGNNNYDQRYIVHCTLLQRTKNFGTLPECTGITVAFLALHYYH